MEYDSARMPEFPIPNDKYKTREIDPPIGHSGSGQGGNKPPSRSSRMDDELIFGTVSAMVEAAREENIQLQPVIEEFLRAAVQAAFEDPSPRMVRNVNTTWGKSILSDMLVTVFKQSLQSELIQRERDENEGRVSFITLFRGIAWFVHRDQRIIQASFNLCDEDL